MNMLGKEVEHKQFIENSVSIEYQEKMAHVYGTVYYFSLRCGNIQQLWVNFSSAI